MLKFRLTFLLPFLWATATFAQSNTILIIADDFGTDYFGLYDEGLDTAKMPNVRALMRSGVRFDQAWATPYCSPTRATILTGRFPFRTGVGTVVAGPTSVQLDTGEVSIAKLLKTAAQPPYATANIGKWHLNNPTPQSRNFPRALGYDHYSGMFIGQVTDYYNWQKIVDGAAAVTVTNYATTELVDDAIDWLETLDPTKPFFLWQAFNAPHTPIHLPPAALHSVPGLTGTQQHITQNRNQYHKAMIEAMDTEIGRLFRWLDAHGLRQNTNIIFIGDNGTQSQVCQFPNANRAKGTLYENGVHVPMLIAGPAVQNPNRNSDALVSVADLFATILELSGVSDWATRIPASKPVDAVSLLPILRNEKNKVRDWVFTEEFTPTPDANDGKTIRDTAYKLIRFDSGREELYHAAQDRFEQNDLLRAPLSAEAEAHYRYLCNELNRLLGTTACSPSVSTDNGAYNPKLSLFPNPATAQLYLGWDSSWKAVSGTISDGMGRIWTRFNPMPGSPIPLETLPAGLFWVTIKTASGQTLTGRFVKYL